MDFIKEKPKFVAIAEKIIYGTLGISGISTLFVFVSGQIEFLEFLSNILFIAVIAAIPYAMGKGNNKARYIYAGYAILSALVMFVGSDYIQSSPRFDVHIGVLLTPIELFVCGMLFTKESSGWFKKSRAVANNAVK